MPRAIEVYVSADVETDGPIPGPFSMSSFALVLAGMRDDAFHAAPLDATRRVAFEREVRPISDSFDPEALAVSGLDREQLARDGADPAAAMADAAAWVHATTRAVGGEGARPVLVAYPLGFDWMWLHWYFVRFTGASPFGHSQALDLKTLFATKADRALLDAGRSRLPAELTSRFPHTHRAIDDATEQADVFARLVAWRPTTEPA